MLGRNAEIGIGTVALVILAVILITVLAFWTTGQVVPTLGEEIEKGKDWVEGIAVECAEMEPINVSKCAESGLSNCYVSENYTDVSTYSVRIPTLAEYWVDVEIFRDGSWADANPNDDCAYECSNNDPDIYAAKEYKPLVYEFRLTDKLFGTYVVDTALLVPPAANTWENVSVYLGVVDQGSYNLQWRIITDWEQCNNPPVCPVGHAGGNGRLGEIGDTIRLYCGGLEGK